MYAADFETTSYAGQEKTEVWAAACAELGSEEVKIFHSIGEQFDYFVSLNENLIVYYHNLKFDGSFWLDYFEYHPKFKQALDSNLRWTKKSDWATWQYSYSISDLGAWYCITVKVGKKFIEIRDSLKLLPFTLEEIGKSLRTKHQKLDMEYKGYRYAGCTITDEEQAYISNDVLVLKEALEIMYEQGHDKLTIGACCLAEYYNTITKAERLTWFCERPLEEYTLPSHFGSENADAYIRKAYRGGWCYLVKGKENRVYKDGITVDVNSLYPSMMHSESGNVFPVGEPEFWCGNGIPEEAQGLDKYFFVRIKCRFRIKPGKLPFIQIKNNPSYKFNENLETSDIFYRGKYYNEYYDSEGNLQSSQVELTLTCVDYKLFLEHYDVYDFEILDGVYFNARSGIFDAYINKYKKIKMESKGAIRQLAKLFLNNLYGKLAASSCSNYKIVVPYENRLRFQTVIANDKKPGYIPIGAAITSYARNFTIRAAQANFHGKDKPGFIYADTDSIHCDIDRQELAGLKIHPVDFCAWKIESHWDKAIYVRQKTYVEHITHEDGEPIAGRYEIKCAGMPKSCKALLCAMLDEDEEEAQKHPEHYEYLYKDGKLRKMDISDFKRGLVVPGKLQPKRIPGGIVLLDSTYELK